MKLMNIYVSSVHDSTVMGMGHHAIFTRMKEFRNLITITFWKFKICNTPTPHPIFFSSKFNKKIKIKSRVWLKSTTDRLLGNLLACKAMLTVK